MKAMTHARTIHMQSNEREIAGVVMLMSTLTMQYHAALLVS